MNKRVAGTLFAVTSAALGSYYYGGYQERKKISQLLPLQQAELLHKVRKHYFLQIPTRLQRN